MKKVIQEALNVLVQHPSNLRLTEVVGAKTVVYEVRCHPDDLGKVIGKSGKTVGALRNLLSALSGREGKRILLEVVD